MTAVSTQLTSDLIAACRERGLEVDAAFAALPVPMAKLEDAKGFAEWDHFAAALDILEELCGGPPDGLTGLSRVLAAPRFLRTVGPLFRFAVSPRQLYQTATRYSGPVNFPNQSVRFEILPGERFRIDIRLDATERGCAAFYRGCRGFFEVAPKLIGLGESIVEADVSPHRGVFVVTPPPSISIFARMGRVLELFRGSATAIDELRGQHESLATQTIALRKARAELEESERRFADAFHASPIPMIVWPIGGDGPLDANHSFLETSGLSEEDLISRPFEALPIWPSELELEKVRTEIRALRAVRAMPCRFRNAEGELRRGLLSSSFSRVAGQQVVLVQLVDITEQWELNERLLQSQKMQVVGQLAGGVAHDFNNLLTVIGGYANQLGESLLDGTDQHDAALRIIEASDRSAKLVAQLLAFARRQILHPERIDLGDTARGTLEMLHRLIGEEFSIRCETASDLPPVVVDSGKIEQVILNLVVNSRDAMAPGGEITIDVGLADPAEVLQAEGAEPQSVAYVSLSVTDQGHGMDQGTALHMFEPFFTTKPTGEGTGLGLSTVQGLVVQSGGRILVRSEVGAGTTIKAFFPAASNTTVGATEDPPSPQRHRGNESVLLVEDDDRVRELVRSQLERAGYRVLVARDGVEALDVETSESGSIDALVTDVVMPHMSGPALSAELRGRYPHLRTLFITGYPLDEAMNGEEHVLLKPFGPGELENALRSALAGVSPSST